MGNRAKPAETPDVAEEVVNSHLNPALEGKFRVKDTHCRYLNNTSIGDVDLTILTEEQAEQLVADGQVFLEKVSS